jgi:hypothetical protein
MTPKTFPAKAAFVVANPKSKLLDQMREVLRVKYLIHSRPLIHP